MRRPVEKPVPKKSIEINGHKTSVSLEDPFFDAFKEIAQSRNLSHGKLAEEISFGADGHNLSSAIRVFVLKHYKDLAEARLTGQPMPDERPHTTNGSGSS